MYLPQELVCALEFIVDKEINLKDLTSKAAEISKSYRFKESHDLESRSHTLAYVASRLPATYAATRRVLSEIPDLPIYSLLELGSGVGVALWATREQFPKLKKATLLEQNPLLISLGQELTRGLEVKINWKQEDISKNLYFPSSDLVMMGYVSGELPQTSLESLIKRAYDSAQQVLVIIEPGTPRGYKRLLKIRQWLLGWGAHILAPCSHHGLCPIKGEDWCHFSVRLSRSILHRTLKKGEIPYEDEKFSYLIASPHAVEKSQGCRILKAPMERSGHIILDLCTPDQITRRVISRKTSEEYKKAKKAAWGDVWSPYETTRF